jgi:hypothetical protein
MNYKNSGRRLDSTVVIFRLLHPDVQTNHPSPEFFPPLGQKAQYYMSFYEEA